MQRILYVETTAVVNQQMEPTMKTIKEIQKNADNQKRIAMEDAADDREYLVKVWSAVGLFAVAMGVLVVLFM